MWPCNEPVQCSATSAMQPNEPVFTARGRNTENWRGLIYALVTFVGLISLTVKPLFCFGTFVSKPKLVEQKPRLVVCPPATCKGPSPGCSVSWCRSEPDCPPAAVARSSPAPSGRRRPWSRRWPRCWASWRRRWASGGRSCWARWPRSGRRHSGRQRRAGQTCWKLTVVP